MVHLSLGNNCTFALKPNFGRAAFKGGGVGICSWPPRLILASPQVKIEILYIIVLVLTRLAAPPYVLESLNPPQLHFLPVWHQLKDQI